MYAACVDRENEGKGCRITKTMSLEVLELLFMRIDEFLRGRRREKVEIIWHGGEPLLLGDGYFSKACEFQEKHCAETRDRIRHTIQTNMTLFTPSISTCSGSWEFRCRHQL